MNDNETTRRRTVLKTVGVLSGIGAGSVFIGASRAQDDPIEGTTIELGGVTSGWQGRAPSSIQGETNPLFRLEAGTTYEIVWENVDNAPHNVVIENEEGETLVESEIITSGTQTVEFTAEVGTTTYYCAVHPSTMSGDIEIVGGGGGTPSETTEESPTETPSDGAAVETVIEISGERVPENLAFDDDGTLYFGITAGEVWTLTAEQTQETGLTLENAEQVGSLPGSAIGVEVVPDGALYVASQSDEGTGVWQLPRDDGDPSLFAAVPTAEGADEVFPNGVLHDAERNRLLVTESFGGVVYEVPLDADNPENAASEWVASDLLNTDTFGANGLTLGQDGNLFVAVTSATADVDESPTPVANETPTMNETETPALNGTPAMNETPVMNGTPAMNETRTTTESDGEVGRIVRVPVSDNGSAGDPATYLETPAILGADGITSRESDLYVAANSLNEVVRITADQQTETVASADDGLVFPSDVLFGTTDAQEGRLFICNFATDNPEDGGILRMQP